MPRSTTERITIRLTPDDRTILDAAIAAGNESWRGISHHVRNAAMHWARGVISQQRLRKMREDVLARPRAEGKR